jgi:hypothetical protein
MPALRCIIPPESAFLKTLSIYLLSCFLHISSAFIRINRLRQLIATLRAKNTLLRIDGSAKSIFDFDLKVLYDPMKKFAIAQFNQRTWNVNSFAVAAARASKKT